VQREVLDPTPRRFAHLNADSLDETPRFVWTTGDETIGHHDLADSGNLHRTLSPHVPGDHVFVADAARPGDADGGWLVGFVHHTTGATTELHVSDAADIAAPVIATVRIPRRIPHGLRCTWIPSTPQ
jgi:carotenoid cleavage dioxygenase